MLVGDKEADDAPVQMKRPSAATAADDEVANGETPIVKMKKPAASGAAASGAAARDPNKGRLFNNILKDGNLPPEVKLAVEDLESKKKGGTINFQQDMAALINKCVETATNGRRYINIDHSMFVEYREKVKRTFQRSWCAGNAPSAFNILR